jgi:hypothetical protein
MPCRRQPAGRTPRPHRRAEPQRLRRPQPDATHPAAPAELKAPSCFRDTWSKLRVDQQFHQALADEPENAGPLNSHFLVLRALRLMRDISPAYLKHFMDYADALLWLSRPTAAPNRPPKHRPR